jgi:hypothetical protein
MKDSSNTQLLDQNNSEQIEEARAHNSVEREKIVDLVSARTVELAVLAGRASHQIRQGDYEQAKREISYDAFEYRL